MEETILIKISHLSMKRGNYFHSFIHFVLIDPQQNGFVESKNKHFLDVIGAFLFLNNIQKVPCYYSKNKCIVCTIALNSNFGWYL